MSSPREIVLPVFTRLSAVGVARAVAVLALSIATTAGAQSSRPAIKFNAPQWAFPTSMAPNPPAPVDSVTRHHVPGSSETFTVAQALNGFQVADWFPRTHPPMPRAVRNGEDPAWRACGFCHLPDGQGRPENATLSGLSAEYIRAQVRAMAAKTRLTANPSSPTGSMQQIASAVPDSDLVTAARYFSKLHLTRRNHVVETARAPRTRVAGILYVRDGSGTEPIAGRLIEVPDDFARHELHDPTITYTAYVPPGSLARGRRLAATGPGGPTTACAACHGPQLRGTGLVPAIAGRSPSYLLRQLLNFKSGARQNLAGAPMLLVVEKLSVSDMVGLAAHVGSLAP